MLYDLKTIMEFKHFKLIGMLLLTLLALSACFSQATDIRQEPWLQEQKSALLILDTQQGVLAHDAPYPVAPGKADVLVAAIQQHILKAQATATPVVLVSNEWPWWRFAENWWFNGAFRKGSRWAEQDPRIRGAAPQAPLFSKSIPNALSNPELVHWLKTQHISHLRIAGLFAEACVQATAEDASKHGYTVEILKDAVLNKP